METVTTTTFTLQRRGKPARLDSGGSAQRGLDDVGGNYQVTMPMTGSAEFYRLSQ